MFELKEEHVMLRDMVREFAERELAPRLAEFESAGRLPEDVIRKIAELNLFGLAFPKELGGADAGLMGYVLAAEELARVSVDAAFMCSVSIGATYPLLFAGSEEQKEKYLKPMVRGEKLGAFALTEPNAGSDAASIETVAIKEGDEYVLNGRKVFITNASIADTYIVFAYTDKSKGAKGISAFIVERGMEGFSFGK
ncbi:acyl-CoA dehydrogenase family protein, partial [Candidatus Alkanophaga liquidiphilum]